MAPNIFVTRRTHVLNCLWRNVKMHGVISCIQCTRYKCWSVRGYSGLFGVVAKVLPSSTASSDSDGVALRSADGSTKVFASAKHSTVTEFHNGKWEAGCQPQLFVLPNGLEIYIDLPSSGWELRPSDKTMLRDGEIW